MILAAIGVSEMMTLLLRSCVVVKTVYLESRRRPLRPTVGDFAIGRRLCFWLDYDRVLLF